MGSRYALIVATDQYSEPGLRELAAPARDAEALAAILADPAVGDFDVKVLRNQSAQDVRLAVEDFFADRDRSDTLMLHFSGHGMKNAAGELYLAAADTRPSRLASTAVGSDFLSRQMADSRAERIVLLLDCCYGGAFPRGMVVRADSEAQVLEAFAAQTDVAGGKGRAVVTASSAMEYAFEESDLTAGSTGSPSVFTGSLVDALATGEADTDGDGWVGLHELFEYVSSAVRRINPHQTPHMWTFGSQGELLIARSKVRRIRPTPLSDELTEALASPLAAIRYGVVDLLRQRLNGNDLSLASTALQTLHQLRTDDSRRVAETASEAVDAACLRTEPSEVQLRPDESGAAEAEVTLLGPPLALVAAVATADPWIRAVYNEPVLRIAASAPGTEPRRGTVAITSPTGSVTLPVTVEVPIEQAAAVVAEQGTVAPDPPAPPPSTVDLSVAVVPPSPPPPNRPAGPLPVVPVGTDEEVRLGGDGIGRWLLAGLFGAGALMLLYANLPGDLEQWKAFYDPEQSGWYVYRSPEDPWVMASVICVVTAGLLFFARGRARPILLGALLGGSLYLLDDGLTFLLLGFAYEDGVGKWTVTVLVAAVIDVAILVVVRPRFTPFVYPGWLPLCMLGLGACLVISNELIALDETTPLDVFGPLVYLSIIVVTTLAAIAICTPHARTREVLATAAATMQIVALYGTFGWRASDQLGPRIAVMLPGTILIVGALMLGLRTVAPGKDLAAPATP